MADPPPKDRRNAKSSRAPQSRSAAESPHSTLDLHSAAATRNGSSRSSAAQPFLGVLFRCCNQYARIYRRSDLTAYAGKCPRCGKMLRVPIGSGGTGTRFFGTQ